MPCDTTVRYVGQLLSDRKEDIRVAFATISKLLAEKKVKAVVDKKSGAVTFVDVATKQRPQILNEKKLSDACIYRRIVKGGNALARQALAQAGAVNEQALTHGVHSHDGGKTWHKGH
jgi:hypothetical protein